MCVQQCVGIAGYSGCARGVCAVRYLFECVELGVRRCGSGGVGV